MDMYFNASFVAVFMVHLLKSIGHLKVCWIFILNPPLQYQNILPIKPRHSLIWSHPLPWPLGAGPAYMARCASSLTIILLLCPLHRMTLTARSSWCELAAVGFVQQQRQQEEEQVNGRQAQVGSCTAAGRQQQAEAVYTSSPLHPPPVNSDPAPAARGYKTHNCRKAQAAQVKAKILLKP